MHLRQRLLKLLLAFPLYFPAPGSASPPPSASTGPSPERAAPASYQPSDVCPPDGPASQPAMHVSLWGWPACSRPSILLPPTHPGNFLRTYSQALP